MSISCSLIITTYNWPEALNKSLESCLLQTVLPTEVIIADDGSKQETKDLIAFYQAKQLPFNLIHCWQEDLGFRAAQSRNNAIQASSADYIICIDGDIILHPRFVEDHLSNAKKNQVIAGKRVRLPQKFSQKIITSNKPISPLSALFAAQSGHKNAIRSNVLSHYLSISNRNADSVFSCNFSFWRQDAINVNGFNCDFVGWGAEDKEFCIRLINDGASKKQLKHLAVCYHLYHPELSRKMEQANQQIYDDAISKKLTYCQNGIKKHTQS
ncbi:glycosyltransferase family 2 protein [Shewanella sp. 4_MG-2023]|uniref:glycosyltransferase family 2 protein n=1 Tax=Shewanella sp. 4_MG-2023 TaxID=3062652 RepID=UPI0026E32572|nr:glycosyltransferase family 2 protein [Shewanella sp. 4_MG-2023]MDO6677991.1 glycosyltransferase family 2 protein [Shewanella sp. 4_MG-2023]